MLLLVRLGDVREERDSLDLYIVCLEKFTVLLKI